METYSAREIASVMRGLNMSVKAETHDEYQALCPFHANRNSPAFSISKKTGVFTCFSPECGKSGTLKDLVMFLTGRNEFEALRFIVKYREDVPVDLATELEEVFSETPEIKEFNPETIERLYNQFWETSPGQEYMFGRGFDEDTLRKFKVGYTPKAIKDRKEHPSVVVPVYTPQGMPMGLVGRSIQGKEFINSPGLKKSLTVFNAQEAKRHGGTAIVTEASFDVMRLAQAGYPQGVALLGGNLSKMQMYYLNRFFNRIIIMTDWDDKDLPGHRKEKGQYCPKCYPSDCEGHNPGRDLGTQISAIPNKEILWASYGFKQVYPAGVKDATDMTVEQVRQCVENAVPDIEYVSWGLY